MSIQVLRASEHCSVDVVFANVAAIRMYTGPRSSRRELAYYVLVLGNPGFQMTDSVGPSEYSLANGEGTDSEIKWEG